MKRKTISEISNLWLADKGLYVKRSTLAAYTYLLHHYLLPVFGSNTALSEREVQQFALACLNRGLSRKTVHDTLVVLKMIVRFGRRQGLTAAACDWQVRFPTTAVPPKVNVLTPEQQRSIMQYIAGRPTLHGLGIYISLATGLRIGEICGLRWDDFNLSTRTISVERTVERIYVGEKGERHTELIVGMPKTENSIRHVPMSDELVRLVGRLMPEGGRETYMLTGSLRPTEPRCLRTHLTQLLRHLDIPHIRFHGLRHSFATRCIESKCDYKTVSVILGHSQISTTLNLYVHPDLEQQHRCIERMSRYVG